MAAQLAESGQIGGLRLRNRAVFPAMLMNFASDRGEVTERLIAFHRRLAQGGYGLIVTECVFVQFKGGIATRGLALYDDRFVPGLARLVNEVHEAGAAIGVQLFFDGAGRTFASDESISIGPSDLTEFGGPYMRPMTAEDIDVMARDFASAARRAVGVGADLIEIHMGHGHLLGRFLSPYFNRRADEFGGSAEARLRFPRKVLELVRAEVGQGVPVTARLSLSEQIPGGIDIKEAIAIGHALKVAGIDAVHTSVGTGTTPVGLASIFPTSFSAEAPFRQWVAEFRQATGLTTIVAGNVSDPETAEELLNSGTADFISAGRAGLADPDWPSKAIRGEAPVPCIGCNQGCADNLVARKEITCTINPRVGFEADFQHAATIPAPADALVVGGGVAGLVCALGLARRGTRVVVMEAALELGGQYRVSGLVPGKERYRRYLDQLLGQVQNAGIEVRLGDQVINDLADLAGRAEAVFWAGGAVPKRWEAAPAGIKILEGWDCFKAPELDDKPKDVAVIGAGQVGCDVAIWLGSRGHRVTLVDRDPDPVAAMLVRRYDYEQALQRYGVHLLAGTEASAGGPGAIALGGVDGITTIRPDLVVTAVGRTPRERPATIARALAIGDAARAGTALDAIRQATFHSACAATRAAAWPQK